MLFIVNEFISQSLSGIWRSRSGCSRSYEVAEFIGHWKNWHCKCFFWKISPYPNSRVSVSVKYFDNSQQFINCYCKCKRKYVNNQSFLMSIFLIIIIKKKITVLMMKVSECAIRQINKRTEIWQLVCNLENYLHSLNYVIKCAKWRLQKSLHIVILNF